MNDFKITEENGKQVIERLVFPRFKAEILFEGESSDLGQIEMIDNCIDVMLLAKSMRDAGEFIYNYKK